MPLDIIIDILFSITELLRLSIITAIPCFAIVLTAEWLHSKISKRFSFSWIKATLLSTYLIVTLLIMFLYLVPAYLGWSESPLAGEPIPAELQPTPLDFAMLLIFAAIKILLSAAAYTILLLPLIFFATYVNDKLKEKKAIPAIASKFIAVFSTSFLAWVILLFVFPFMWGGLIYLLFWS